MEVLLKFELPDDDDEFWYAKNAKNLADVLSHILDRLGCIINGHDKKREEYRKVCEEIRDDLVDELITKVGTFSSYI